MPITIEELFRSDIPIEKRKLFQRFCKEMLDAVNGIRYSENSYVNLSYRVFSHWDVFVKRNKEFDCWTDFYLYDRILKEEGLDLVNPFGMSYIDLYDTSTVDGKLRVAFLERHARDSGEEKCVKRHCKNIGLHVST